MTSLVSRGGAPARAGGHLAARVAEQARFAARAFRAQWSRETGEEPSAVVADRMLLAYEVGYLRGYGAGRRRVCPAGGAAEQVREQPDLVAREFVA